MPSLTSYQIYRLYCRTLSAADHRIIDHGERVAHKVLQMLKLLGNTTKEQTEQAFRLSLLHDIGVFHTAPLDPLGDASGFVQFEAGHNEPHSAYGYLFLRSFLPQQTPELDAVLFHHTPYSALVHSPCKGMQLASLIQVADRCDLLFQLGREDAIRQNLLDYRGRTYAPQAVDLYLETLEQGYGHDTLVEDIQEFYQGRAEPDDVVSSYLEMLACFIDYRSHYTVDHTIRTVGISLELAHRLGLPDNVMPFLHQGAMMHDVGKIATPINILEKPGKLTPYEFTVMQDHVRLSEQLLTGCLSTTAMRIAVRHHEKLDGSGYPHGLHGSELTMAERIVAVADMASALFGRRSYKESMPEEKVIAILDADAEKGRLCPETVRIFHTDCAAIMHSAAQNIRETLLRYHSIEQDYPGCLSLVESLNHA